MKNQQANIPLLNFLKVFTRAKKYCLLLRDPVKFRSMRKSLDKNYEKVAKLGNQPQLANLYQLQLQEYTRLIENDLLKFHAMSVMFEDEQGVLLDLQKNEDQITFYHRVKMGREHEILSEQKFYELFYS